MESANGYGLVPNSAPRSYGNSRGEDIAQANAKRDASVRGGPVCNSPVPPAGGVAEEQTRQLSLLESLHTLITLHGDRLCTVLRPIPPSTSTEQGVDRPAPFTVAQRLDHANWIIHLAIERLDSLTTRLEL